MSASPEPERLLIGWKELVDLPELGLTGLKAKIDTGARTSALHVEEVHTIAEHPDGSAELELVLSPDRRRPEETIRTRARRVATVQVTDSGGHRSSRPVIETELVLGGRSRRVRITLADRTTMLFRMILGRKALEGRFVVDVVEKYLHGAPPRRTRRGGPAAPPGERP